MQVRPGHTRYALATAAALAALSLGGCGAVQAAKERLVVLPPPRCENQRVQIYFEPQSAEVTPEGRAVLRQAAAQARGCTVQRVEVIGLADAAGAADANLELSGRRASTVAAALTQAGLPAAEFSVAAAGQAGAVSSEGLPRPLRRRADIVLHLARP